MRQPTYDTTKLPRRILQEFGASLQDYNGARTRKTGFGTRKSHRKASRVEKKRHAPPQRHATVEKRQVSTESEENKILIESTLVQAQPTKPVSVQSNGPKSILKKPKVDPLAVAKPVLEISQYASPEVSVNVPKTVKNRLAQDDAEIEALEKALGVKDRKKLPKSFEDDGLEFLLDGLDDIGSLDKAHTSKRKRNGEQVWLEKKRQKAQAVYEEPGDSGHDLPSDLQSLASENEKSQEEEQVEDAAFDSEDPNFGTSEDGWSENEPSTMRTKRVRENPYVAPSVNPSMDISAKYIPPSLRDQPNGDSEKLSQLRRQLQGLLNRLSEANLISVVGDVEKLYQLYPRQHVSSNLFDLLLGLLSDPTTLNDTFILLHAGFIAALYKVLGTDFGSQIIARIDDNFSIHYHGPESASTTKGATNLMGLLAHLYNFQVIGSGLIYDYIRLCLKELSENNTDLLLRIVRVAGQQLRQDDPSALKEIVIQLHAAASKLGENELSVRMKFMIETINNLKNNRMKTGIAASSVSSEHTVRMKKTVGSMNQKSVKATEPLRIGLSDLRDSEKKGKWWLVGASFKDDTRQNPSYHGPKHNARGDTDEGFGIRQDAAGDLVQLAKAQRMNTDVRRSIFVAIMSASDYNDAYLRLMKLRLKRSQELEIPKVLIHCAGAEKKYNPFYTLLSRRVCSDRRLKMAFQFSLWDLFKQMGEKDDDDKDSNGDDEVEDKLDLQSIVNLARMFGTLISGDGLSLAVLKKLNLAYLQPKTSMFLELLLITTILQSQRSREERNEAALVDIFLKPKEMQTMASSL
ncbi:MAG: hypothetical protein Q9164_006659, partial [Protoblastenia rupestris]